MENEKMLMEHLKNRIEENVYRNQFLWRLFTRFNNSSYKFSHSMRCRPSFTLCASVMRCQWNVECWMLPCALNEMYHIFSMLNRTYLNEKERMHALVHWQWHLNWARYFELTHAHSYTIHSNRVWNFLHWRNTNSETEYTANVVKPMQMQKAKAKSKYGRKTFKMHSLLQM